MVAYIKDYKSSPDSVPAKFCVERLFRQTSDHFGRRVPETRMVTGENGRFPYDACLSPSLAQGRQTPGGRWVVDEDGGKTYEMNPYVVAGVAATGFLVADDATVVGIADDIFIPVVWTGLGVAALVDWVFFSDKSTQSKPTDAPPGTKPIDQSGLGRKNTHTVKDGVGAGPKDWTGIAPNGDVITSGPDGKHINHGPWETYLP